jgi:hypothetical protein
MVDVVEEPGDVRFDSPVVSATLPLDRHCVDGIKSTHMRPVAIATAQDVLLVDCCESTRDCPRHQRLLHHGHAQWTSCPTPFRSRVSSDECGTVACALETLDKVPEVVLQGVRLRLSTHPVHAVGGVLLDRSPAVSHQLRIAHPLEVLKPVMLLAFCLLCSAWPGGWPCGPTLHVRAMLPGHASSDCPPLPRVIGSPVSAYSERLGLPRGHRAPLLFLRGVSLALSPQEPRGSPTCLTPLSTPTTLLVDPGRPSGISPQRSRWVGFWGVKTIAICMIALTGLSQASESAVSPTVSVVPCGRFPRVVRLAPPPQVHHAVGVVGETFLSRDFHPARNAKLRLAH